MELAELQELKRLLKTYRKMYVSSMQEVDDVIQISNNIDKIVDEKAYVQK